ncbi:MAG: hypothetical protein ACOYJG_08400, partial [Prevotella sp.]
SVFQVRGDIGQENQTAFRSKPESRLIPFFSGKTRLLTHPPPCNAEQMTYLLDVNVLLQVRQSSRAERGTSMSCDNYDVATCDVFIGILDLLIVYFRLSDRCQQTR